MKYSFIAAHQEEFPINRLCQVLNVSESGYYAWRKREPSQRQREDEHIGKRIEDAYQNNRGCLWQPTSACKVKGAGGALWKKTGSQTDARAWDQCEDKKTEGENDG